MHHISSSRLLDLVAQRRPNFPGEAGRGECKESDAGDAVVSSRKDDDAIVAPRPPGSQNSCAAVLARCGKTPVAPGERGIGRSLRRPSSMMREHHVVWPPCPRRASIRQVFCADAPPRGQSRRSEVMPLYRRVKTAKRSWRRAAQTRTRVFPQRASTRPQ